MAVLWYCLARTLVGERGITYKYLGLREFAHPWDFSTDSRGDSVVDAEYAADGACGVAHDFREKDLAKKTALCAVKELNRRMTDRATALLHDLACQRQVKGKGQQQRQLHGQKQKQQKQDRGGCEEKASLEMGSCKFNLVLINRMVVGETSPAKNNKQNNSSSSSGAEQSLQSLKEEPFYGMGRCSGGCSVVYCTVLCG